IKEPRTTHKELQAIEFARVLDDYLRHAAQQEKFDSLVLVAPPHFLGLLRAELNPALASLISTTVPKDLLYMDQATIRQHLTKDVWPARQN
ncbi:MAG TPA: host attachment protein, partial [Tepidisphaeraceae bacterium]|nr:host attachment protein [Tepidisphaeraceae bacterium]